MKSQVKRLRLGGAHVEVWRDASLVATRAAELFTETARQSVASEGRFTVALSGGSTPRALYELLAGDVYAPRTPWDASHIFWSDERSVPPESDESNYHLAYEAMLSRLPVPASQIHRMRGEDEPHRAAMDYERILVEEFDETPPRFDLILLGMGEDGHTASLFPGSSALAESERLVAAPFVEKLNAHRLTMTLRTINAASSVIFMVAGEAKANALRAVLEEERSEDGLYPAQMVRPVRGELIWLVDERAASLLSA